MDGRVVGGAIDQLVCDALLAKKGRKALLPERSERIGDCLRTEKVTTPVVLHDVTATTCVLFVTGPVHAALSVNLARLDVSFVHGDRPAAVLRPDGSWAVLTLDRVANVAALEALAPGEGAAASALKPAGAAIVKRGVAKLLEEFRAILEGSCAPDQFFLWRPFAGLVNHRTGNRDLWHIGASTHPGPGLGGGSGALVADRIR